MADPLRETRLRLKCLFTREKNLRIAFETFVHYTVYAFLKLRHLPQV